jgi:hypothetical protein
MTYRFNEVYVYAGNVYDLGEGKCHDEAFGLLYNVQVVDL